MLKDLVNNCISILPSSIRLPMEVSKVAVRGTLRNWSLFAYLVRGQIAGELRQGSMIYLGEDHRYYRSWIGKFLVDVKPVEPLGRMRLPDILRLKGPLAEHDLVLCPMSKLLERVFSKRGWLSIPRQVDCVVDLGRPIEEIFSSRNIKKRVKRLRRFSYDFRVLKSELALEEFYYQMLLPTVRKRHEEKAYISNLEDLRRMLENGFLLAAYRNSEWVGAELVVYQNTKTLRSANAAWRDGDERLMKNRINDALIFELIKRAKADGFEFLNLGNSLPFVDDGVLNSKLHWGANLKMPSIKYEDGKLQGVRGFLAVKFNQASENGKSMLHHTPLLARHKGKVITVGWNSPLRKTFQRQIDRGVQWVDLEKTQSSNDFAD